MKKDGIAKRKEFSTIPNSFSYNLILFLSKP